MTASFAALGRREVPLTFSFSFSSFSFCNLSNSSCLSAFACSFWAASLSCCACGEMLPNVRETLSILSCLVFWASTSSSSCFCACRFSTISSTPPSSILETTSSAALRRREVPSAFSFSSFSFCNLAASSCLSAFACSFWATSLSCCARLVSANCCLMFF